MVTPLEINRHDMTLALRVAYKQQCFTVTEIHTIYQINLVERRLRGNWVKLSRNWKIPSN